MPQPQGANKARYIIGIDLGTTNSAVSYFDRMEEAKGLQRFSIEQWQSDQYTVNQPTLPSFCYIPTKSERKKHAFKLPGDSSEEGPEVLVGELAKFLSVEHSQRVINSAKSWLCHPGINREEKILPWHSDELIGSQRYSPVEVSAFILEHIKKSWNQVMATHSESYRLKYQDVIITVPASFDESAQRLTIKAAEQAGIPSERITLMEEPQAAFYFWCQKHHVENQKALTEVFPNLSETNQIILICDIGGGTTDFSLFQISHLSSQSKAPQIERIKVGEHLLLGGDNIDLKIAQRLEEHMGTKLESKNWNLLISQVRSIKEKALAETFQDLSKEFHVSIAAGGGSNLFAQTYSAKISLKELKSLIIDEFFCECAQNARPRIQEKSSKTDWGLHYPEDLSITKHLAQFLSGKNIDAVLFTGGTLTPTFIQQKIIQVISSWQKDPVLHLDNGEMDLAVSLGATSYGIISEQKTVDIKSAYPRSLYLAAANEQQELKLICLVPKGYDGAEQIRLDHLPLKARINQVACFYLFSSTEQIHKIGEIISFDESTFRPLPVLHAKFEIPNKGKDERSIDIGIIVKLEHTGLLNLDCYSKEDQTQQWTLDFDTSGKQKGIDLQTLVFESKQESKVQLSYAVDLIDTFYGKKIKDEGISSSPNQIIKSMEKKFDSDKRDWGFQFLRALWPLLIKGMNKRGRSSNHEMAWFNMAGFSLRPGFGSDLDSFHVNELWKVYEQGMSFPNEAKVKDQWWIMWRRVAGGLDKDQQTKIFKKIFPTIKKVKESTPEMYMLAGSLERLPLELKVQLGNALVEQILSGRKQFMEQRIWAISRIASRHPLYGGVDCVIRPAIIEKWFDQLSGLNSTKSLYKGLNNFYAQAGRMVNDREFDLPDALRFRFVAKMEASKATEQQITVVKSFHEMTQDARDELFGEQLPIGILI